jgi:hypothetical protein
VEDSCEHGNEPSGSVKFLKFFIAAERLAASVKKCWLIFFPESLINVSPYVAREQQFDNVCCRKCVNMQITCVIRRTTSREF